MALYTLLCTALLLTPESTASLTLEEVLDALKASHPIFMKSQLEIEQARVDLSKLKAEEVWRLELREENVARGGDPANPFGPQRAYGVATRAAVQRDFWENGSRLEVGLDASYMYLEHEQGAGSFSLGAPNLPDVAIPLTKDGLQSALSLQYTYPLLRNPGVLKVLSLENAALKVTEIAFRTKEAQELAMLSVASLYLRWWLLTEQEEILGKRVALARENKRVVVKRKRARLAEKVDVLRSEQALQRALGGLAECQSKLAGTTAELQLLTGLGSLSLKKPAPLALKPEVLSTETAIWTDETRRLSLLKTIKTRLQLQVKVEEERFKPDLALVMRAGIRREDFRYTDEASEGEFNPDGFAGLMLNVPLDRSSASSAIESARIGERIVNEEIREARLSLVSAMARIEAEVQALQVLIEVKDRQLSIATQRSSEEQKMFKLGRTLLNFVIESQDEVQQAKMERLEVVGKLKQLELERLALMDSLVGL